MRGLALAAIVAVPAASQQPAQVDLTLTAGSTFVVKPAAQLLPEVATRLDVRRDFDTVMVGASITESSPARP